MKQSPRDIRVVEVNKPSPEAIRRAWEALEKLAQRRAEGKKKTS